MTQFGMEERKKMYADELLVAMKPRLNDYYFGILKMWLEAHKTHGLFKRKTKFEVQPTGATRGYYIADTTRCCTSIVVYDKDSFMGVASVFTLGK